MRGRHTPEFLHSWGFLVHQVTEKLAEVAEIREGRKGKCSILQKGV